eukprot:4646193-Pyramimonas_sp.AAC.1
MGIIYGNLARQTDKWAKRRDNPREVTPTVTRDAKLLGPTGWVLVSSGLGPTALNGLRAPRSAREGWGGGLIRVKIEQGGQGKDDWAPAEH